MPVEEVRLGETLLVKPGETIPMDGRVLTGASGVNQAPITGESVPVAKMAEDEVFAGTINGEGVLTIEVGSLAQYNTISRIIQLVEDAQSIARSQPAHDRPLCQCVHAGSRHSGRGGRLCAPSLLRCTVLRHAHATRFALSRPGYARDCMSLCTGHQHAGDCD